MVRACVMALALLVISSMAQLPSPDVLVLLEFKKSIRQDPTGYVTDSWNEESIDFNGCPSSWNGIMCSGQNVAAVVLNNLNLLAETNLSVFASLSRLFHLSLSNNSLSGSFPDNLAAFKSLTYLDISNNFYSGTLPPTIGQLRSLRNLSVAGNNFCGSVPDSISELTAIRSLDLSRNFFSGAIPSSLSGLKNLIFLNISNNHFSMGIPSGFEMLRKLKVLDLHNNSLMGDIDEKFLQSSKAVHVDFSDNLLRSFSSEESFLYGLSESVEYLNLSNNCLSGSLVGQSRFLSFGNLKVLDLSHNQLHGELPRFEFVYTLEVLKLRNNRFYGSLPIELLRDDSLMLTELDLSHNNLSGPVSIITSTSLLIVDLSFNAFTSELPLLIGRCRVLDLSRNKLTGNVSAITKWGRNVEHLDLSQNQLTGIFPELSSQFIQLSYLNLSYNSLSNLLPLSLTHCPKLGFLDLSFNQFRGPLPSGLLNSYTLKELHLQNNWFNGSIRLSLQNRSNIRVLDISRNQFIGTIPDELISLSGLQLLNISKNNFSGQLPQTLSHLPSLDVLDLSSNHFTGLLLEDLPNTLRVFNVSYNDLSGFIPPKLRRFPQSSFHPGNSRLYFSNASSASDHSHAREPSSCKSVTGVAIIISTTVAAVILLPLLFIIYYKKALKRQTMDGGGPKSGVPEALHQGEGEAGDATVILAEDLMTSRKCSSSGIIDHSEKIPTLAGCSPSKTSQVSWSPDSGESSTHESVARLDLRSPDRLAGKLHFLDDSIVLKLDELSRAPAEVLGRSNHGTSYKATLENGASLRVKWLREGVAKPRKEFEKAARKFANIRHPNVVSLRGYYWGPTEHEKLLLSDYVACGSLASFIYDGLERQGPPLMWAQRLKIAVDIARGLNYLHFDRAVPHGNLKASNILLDGQELTARVADYFLHCLTNQAGMTGQLLEAGAIGYFAPELVGSKKPSPSFKSDVYAFGVILLELLTGRCARDLVCIENRGFDLTEWVRLRVSEGHGVDCFDASLMSEIADPAVVKDMEEVLGIALRCICSSSERPRIKSVYEDLSAI